MADFVAVLRKTLDGLGETELQEEEFTPLPTFEPAAPSDKDTLLLAPKERDLMFVGAGLPEPELNADVHDDHGQWILCADFLWRAQRVVAEYQGDHHRVDRRQWQFDVARRRLAEANSWTVVDITAHDVFDAYHRSQVVGRLSHLLLG